MEIRFQKPLQLIWLKASVVGSLWASVEIILGSFFHNLNLPFSGTMLSFLGVWLMITFIQIWKESGLLWRAGLICALMKSISPSAIILGPMIGIFTEALLLELSIFLLGKNLAGYLAGGALAVFSTIIHKTVNLLITYGFDFINILSALYKFGVKQLHINDLKPATLLTIIAVIYLLTGMIAAGLGYLSGKKYMKDKVRLQSTEGISLQLSTRIFSPVPRHDFSVYFLFINIIAVFLCLVLLNYGFFILSIGLSVIYISFCIYRYHTIMKRLMKISLWIQFIIITLTAAILWKGLSDHEFFSYEGMIIGLRMSFRAMLIIIGFAGISIELKNPVIKSILYKKGFANVYQSLTLAFSALPGIISALPKPSAKRFNWHVMLSELFSKAENLLLLFETENSQRPDIIIIKGDIGEGKTSFAGKVVELLQQNGKIVTGFFASGVQVNDERIGFDLFNISDSSLFPICRTLPCPGWIKHGKYYFNPDAFRLGNETLTSGIEKGSDLIVIDEIGPMELNDQGWANSITMLCQRNIGLQLWIVRRNLVEMVSRKWNTGRVFIFDISEETVAEVTEKIGELIALKKSSENQGDEQPNSELPGL